jgi:ribosomal protein L30/L7E
VVFAVQSTATGAFIVLKRSVARQSHPGRSRNQRATVDMIKFSQCGNVVFVRDIESISKAKISLV